VEGLYLLQSVSKNGKSGKLRATDSDAIKQIYHLNDLKVWVERELRPDNRLHPQLYGAGVNPKQRALVAPTGLQDMRTHRTLSLATFDLRLYRWVQSESVKAHLRQDAPGSKKSRPDTNVPSNNFEVSRHEARCLRIGWHNAGNDARLTLEVMLKQMATSP
jgi:hypothetical protein